MCPSVVRSGTSKIAETGYQTPVRGPECPNFVPLLSAENALFYFLDESWTWKIAPARWIGLITSRLEPTKSSWPRAEKIADRDEAD
jgi:hypothetical protein